MRLIIEIDEGKYKTITSYPKEWDEWALNTIKNGVPLPKGCGRLIDAREYENSIRKHYFDNDTVIRCTEIALGNAETIIEADTESEG